MLEIPTTLANNPSTNPHPQSIPVVVGHHIDSCILVLVPDTNMPCMLCLLLCSVGLEDVNDLITDLTQALELL